MGRQIRMVPRGWEHPRKENGNYIPLHKGPFSKDLADWEEGNTHWQAGEIFDWSTSTWVPKTADVESTSYEEWSGSRPEQQDYMPEWSPTDATMLVMYEDTTEGTPISPTFETPEELARWLADNRASAFGGMTATYEQWLVTCKSGRGTVGMVIGGGRMISGVEAAAEKRRV